MLIWNSTARNQIGSPAPLTRVVDKKTFAHIYCYLGCVIDDELILSKKYKSVYRKAERKVYDTGV